MGPKNKRGADSDTTKVARRRATKVGDPADSEIVPQASNDVMRATGVNGAVYELIQSSWASISAHPVFANITDAEPLDVISESGSESGFQAAFNVNAFKAAMANHGKYACGINFFWASIFYSPRPTTPLRMASIESVIDQYLSDDAPPTTTDGVASSLVIAVREGEDPTTMKGHLRRVTPEESTIAPVVKLARLIQSGRTETLKEWRSYFLSFPAEFRACRADDEKWMSDNIREKLGGDFEAYYPTPLQVIFKIANHRAQISTFGRAPAEHVFRDFEANVTFSAQGRATHDKFTLTLVQTALSIWDNLVSKPEFQTILLAQDNDPTVHVWDSVYKLEAVLRKVGRDRDERKLKWLLSYLVHEIKWNSLTPGELSVAALSGKRSGGFGIIDIALMQLSLQDYILNHFMDERSFEPSEKALAREVFGSHESYRAKYGENLDWLGGLSAPSYAFFNLAEGLIFKPTYKPTLLQSARTQRSHADTLATAPISDLVQAVDNALETRTPRDKPDKDLVAHACVGARFSIAVGAAQVDNPDTFVERLSAHQEDVIAAAEEKVSRQLAEYVTIVPQVDQRSDMQVKLAATSVGQMRGSEADGYILIYFNANLSGESATQPSSRRPYVTQPLVKGLLAPVLGLHCGEQETLHDGDLFAFLDGGKFGLESVMLGSLVHPDTGKSLPKTKKTVFISRSEEAANSNNDVVRGVATVQQLESLHLVSKNALRTQKKTTSYCRRHDRGHSHRASRHARRGLAVEVHCRTEEGLLHHR